MEAFLFLLIGLIVGSIATGLITRRILNTSHRANQERAQTALSQLEAQLHEEQEQLQQVREENSQLESQVTQRQGQLDDLTQERSQLQEQVSQIQNQLESFIQELSRVQEQATEQEGRLETTIEERSQLQGQLETATQQCSELESQLEAVSQQRSELQENIYQLQRELSQQQDQAEEEQEKLSELPEQFSGEIAQLLAQLEATNLEKEQLKSQLAEVSKPVEELTPNLEILKSNSLVVAKTGECDYSTIGEAIKNAKPGTSIVVRPGLYKESLVINKPVELIGNSSEEPTIIESVDSSCIQIQTDYALIRGLTLRARGRNYTLESRQGQLVVEDCDIKSFDYTVMRICGFNVHAVIRRCHIHDGKWNGVWISSSAEGILEDSQIFGNGHAGIGVGQGSQVEVRRCQINRNGGEAIAVYNYGKVKVEDCDLTENGDGPWRIFGEGFLDSSEN
ncbi:MAG: right-handed parallel beta-helix repeat-containing protein [Coleofasciculaceae cyanobacterium]